MPTKITFPDGSKFETDDKQHLAEALSHLYGNLVQAPAASSASETQVIQEEITQAAPDAPSEPEPTIQVAQEANLLDQNISAIKDHPESTTYVYSSGYLHDRGDVLRYMRSVTTKIPAENGTPEREEVRMHFQAIGRWVNGTVMPIPTNGGFVFFDKEKGRLRRAMSDKSAAKDLIVLNFPPPKTSSAEPTQGANNPPTEPPIMVEAFPEEPESDIATLFPELMVPEPSRELPPEIALPGLQAWCTSQKVVYDQFRAEQGKCERLRDLISPRVFQIADQYYLELLSFTTQATYGGNKPLKEFVGNWTLDEHPTKSNHPLLATEGGSKETAPFYTLMDSEIQGKPGSREIRCRKIFRLLDEVHALRFFLIDEGRPEGDKNVFVAWYAVGNDKTFHRVEVVSKAKYDQLWDAKRAKKAMPPEPPSVSTSHLN
jgi:hypothetical protein